VVSAIGNSLYLARDFTASAVSYEPQVQFSAFPMILCMCFPDCLRFHGIAGLIFRHSVGRSNKKEASMNWDQVEGKWKQYAGKLKEKWGKLTDDDLTAINGKRDQLVGKLQERYGMAKDQAGSQIDEFVHRLSEVDVQREARKTHGAGS
jgi:uncharacterized protein YjbJ (UPF0337 family)